MEMDREVDREVDREMEWEVLSREGGEALIETVKLSLS